MSRTLLTKIIILKRVGILKRDYSYYINLIKVRELRKTHLYKYFKVEFNKMNEDFPESWNVILDHVVLIHNLGYKRDVKSKNLYIYGDSNVGKSRFINLLRKIYNCVNFSSKGLSEYKNKIYRIITFEEFRFTYLPKDMDLEAFKMFLEGTGIDIQNINKNDNPTCVFTSNSSIKQGLIKKANYVGINEADIHAFANRFDELNVDEKLEHPYVIYKFHNREKIRIEIRYKFQVFVNVLEKYFKEKCLDLKI